MSLSLSQIIETDKEADTVGPIDVQSQDTLSYRLESTGSLTPSTAVVSYYTQRAIEEEPLLVAAVAIDGTANDLDVSKIAYISFAVTTAEASTRGNLHIYTRKNQE